MKDAVPATVGVPEIRPEEVLSVRPEGSDPLSMLQEYGAVPPVASRTWEYGVPTIPDARDAVETVSESGPPFVAPTTPAHPLSTGIEAMASAMSEYLRLAAAIRL
jgi:hypothetical protein